jgi:hypothetical protein
VGATSRNRLRAAKLGGGWVAGLVGAWVVFFTYKLHFLTYKNTMVIVLPIYTERQGR